MTREAQLSLLPGVMCGWSPLIKQDLWQISFLFSYRLLLHTHQLQPWQIGFLIVVLWWNESRQAKEKKAGNGMDYRSIQNELVYLSYFPSCIIHIIPSALLPWLCISSPINLSCPPPVYYAGCLVRHHPAAVGVSCISLPKRITL